MTGKRAGRDAEKSNGARKGSDGSSEDVGYKKPPKATRFQPGKSGNPAGRPKGTKNHKKSDVHSSFKEFMEIERQRLVRVNGLDGPTEIPSEQAVIRSAIHSAIKGGPRAQKHLMDYWRNLDSERSANFAELLVLRMQLQEAGISKFERVDPAFRDVWTKRKQMLERRVERTEAECAAHPPNLEETPSIAMELDNLRFSIEQIDKVLEGDQEALSYLERYILFDPNLFVDDE